MAGGRVLKGGGGLILAVVERGLGSDNGVLFDEIVSVCVERDRESEGEDDESLLHGKWASNHNADESAARMLFICRKPQAAARRAIGCS